MNRREFTKKSAMAAGLLSAASIPSFGGSEPLAGLSLKKGIMWGSVGTGKTVMEKFMAAKEAGFDGIEPDSHLERNEVLKAMEITGLKVPSVCDSRHWKFLMSSPDEEVRQQGVDALKVALEDAKTYGADTVLLVPGRVTESVGYDQCWDRSVAEIKKALPLAEQLKVSIAVENVWNNFLLSPLEAARYIDLFASPYVKAYFDIGNIVAYGWPEQWIRILGKRIAKVHIKEYSRKIADTQGRGKGFDVRLREGDVNWSSVMKELADSGYTGWATVEMPGGNTPEGLKDLCDRLNLILA